MFHFKAYPSRHPCLALSLGFSNCPWINFRHFQLFPALQMQLSSVLTSPNSRVHPYQSSRFPIGEQLPVVLWWEPSKGMLTGLLVWSTVLFILKPLLEKPYPFTLMCCVVCSTDHWQTGNMRAPFFQDFLPPLHDTEIGNSRHRRTVVICVSECQCAQKCVSESSAVM